MRLKALRKNLTSKLKLKNLYLLSARHKKYNFENLTSSILEKKVMVREIFSKMF